MGGDAILWHEQEASRTDLDTVDLGGDEGELVGSLVVVPTMTLIPSVAVVGVAVDGSDTNVGEERHQRGHPLLVPARRLNASCRTGRRDCSRSPQPDGTCLPTRAAPAGPTSATECSTRVRRADE